MIKLTHLQKDFAGFQMTFSLRTIIDRDIPFVEEIEKEAFPTLWPRTPIKRDMHNKRIAYLVVTDLDLSPMVNHSTNSIDYATPPGESPNLYKKLSRTIQSKLFHQGPPVETRAELPLGFASIWFLADDAHITAIAVSNSWRGHGLGELLMIGSIESAISRNSRVVTLEVRASNSIAISLYQKYGFKKTGIRKAYYNDNREDAVIMTTEPIRSFSYEHRFSELCGEYSQRYCDLGLAMTNSNGPSPSTGLL